MQKNNIMGSKFKLMIALILLTFWTFVNINQHAIKNYPVPEKETEDTFEEENRKAKEQWIKEYKDKLPEGFSLKDMKEGKFDPYKYLEKREIKIIERHDYPINEKFYQECECWDADEDHDACEYEYCECELHNI